MTFHRVRHQVKQDEVRSECMPVLIYVASCRDSIVWWQSSHIDVIRVIEMLLPNRTLPLSLGGLDQTKPQRLCRIWTPIWIVWGGSYIIRSSVRLCRRRSNYRFPVTASSGRHQLSHRQFIELDMPNVVTISNATRIWEPSVHWVAYSQCGTWDPCRRGVDIWECVRERESISSLLSRFLHGPVGGFGTDITTLVSTPQTSPHLALSRQTRCTGGS